MTFIEDTSFKYEILFRIQMKNRDGRTFMNKLTSTTVTEFFLEMTFIIEMAFEVT